MFLKGKDNAKKGRFGVACSGCGNGWCAAGIPLPFAL
jgi:hypothetical protein